jgi:copper(I)-binding protein
MTFLRMALAASVSASAIAVALPSRADEAIHIADPYVRLLPGAKAGAAFFVIENHATIDDRLIGAAADVAGKAELHTHMMQSDGTAQMLPIEGGIAIPAGGSHALERGADHVMLMMLNARPAEGEAVTLTLTFEQAGEVTVEAPVDNQR